MAQDRVKVTVEIQGKEKMEFIGGEAAIVMKDVKNQEGGNAVTLIVGNIPFMMFAHDQICDQINALTGGKKHRDEAEEMAEAFADFLQGIFGAAAGDEDGNNGKH